jgi:hypothetical protein
LNFIELNVHKDSDGVVFQVPEPGLIAVDKNLAIRATSIFIYCFASPNDGENKFQFFSTLVPTSHRTGNLEVY